MIFKVPSHPNHSMILWMNDGSMVLYNYWKWLLPTLILPSPVLALQHRLLPLHKWWCRFVTLWQCGGGVFTVSQHQLLWIVIKLKISTLKAAALSKCTGLALQLMCPPRHWKTQPQVAEKGCNLSVHCSFTGLAC